MSLVQTEALWRKSVVKSPRVIGFPDVQVGIRQFVRHEPE